MIGGVIKYFRFSYDYVLWEISYQNLAMLLATIPTYEAQDLEKGKEKVEHVSGLDALQEFFK
jgi:hypothetical protein